MIDDDPVNSSVQRKSKSLTIRLTDEMAETLNRLTQHGPYRVTITSIIERGLMLVEKELDEMRKEHGGVT